MVIATTRLHGAMLALKNVVPAMVVRSLVAPSAAARSLAKEHFDAKKAHGKLSVLPLIAHERPIGERCWITSKALWRTRPLATRILPMDVHCFLFHFALIDDRPYERAGAWTERGLPAVNLQSV